MAEPCTAGLSVDDVETTSRRREIIRSKPFLRHVYEEWYRFIAAADSSLDAPLLEIGSGGGFFADVVPNVISSDVLAVPGTGAYCRSLASNYNHVPRPAVVAVREGEARVIVRRETEDDLFNLDVG